MTALGQVIDKLQAENYKFDSIGEALGAPNTNVKVHGYQLWAGKAFILGIRVSVALLPWLVALLSIAGFLVFGRFGLMIILATLHVRRTRRPGFSWGPPVSGPVTVLVPAYNERECIANTLNSLAASDHPIEVIVIDDGSTDGTSS